MKYNLKNLQSYYCDNLINRQFVFETDDGQIVVRFDESNFCHLLGLHHFNNKFQGYKGWNAISDEVITHKILKNINKKLYNDTYKPRVNVLYKVLDIFQNADSFYSFTKIAMDKDFKCDFLIYNQEESTYSILTAFMDKETYDFCAGASLLELNANDPKLLKYLHPLNPAHAIKNYYIDYEMNEMNNLSFIKPDEYRLIA